ncbi:MAG: hypothetical protein ACP5HF_03050 [Candidatus Micrarchaeia archaeon]
MGKIGMEFEKGKFIERMTLQEMKEKLFKCKGFAPILAEEAAKDRNVRGRAIAAIKEYIKQARSESEVEVLKGMLTELEVITFLEALNR